MSAPDRRSPQLRTGACCNANEQCSHNDEKMRNAFSLRIKMVNLIYHQIYLDIWNRLEARKQDSRHRQNSNEPLK